MRRELLELLAAVGVPLEHACEFRGAALQGKPGSVLFISFLLQIIPEFQELVYPSMYPIPLVHISAMGW